MVDATQDDVRETLCRGYDGWDDELYVGQRYKDLFYSKSFLLHPEISLLLPILTFARKGYALRNWYHALVK